MTTVLAAVGWVATAVAAFFFGIILEHSEQHDQDRVHRGSRDA
jgi:hypothetical protein